MLQSVEDSLDNRALGLSELLNLISTGGMRHVDLGLLGFDGNVVLQRRVVDFDVVVAPSSE